MEASGHAGWFERLLAELNFELWTGDAAKIAAKRVRKQKTDRRDAQHILTLMVKDDFPKIWVPSWENRDLRQLLWHRHRKEQTRTRIMNQLQAAALNDGLRYKKKLWREAGRQQLESLPLAPWASRRRRDLLEVLDRINPIIAELTRAIEQQAEKCPEARRLMSHPGVGALTKIAFVLIIGKADRFSRCKQIASYLGLVPEEDSSGERRRLGHVSKQGNSLLRFLLVEAAQVTVRSDTQWRNRFFHLARSRRRHRDWLDCWSNSPKQACTGRTHNRSGHRGGASPAAGCSDRPRVDRHVRWISQCRCQGAGYRVSARTRL